MRAVQRGQGWADNMHLAVLSVRTTGKRSFGGGHDRDGRDREGAGGCGAHRLGSPGFTTARCRGGVIELPLMELLGSRGSWLGRHGLNDCELERLGGGELTVEGPRGTGARGGAAGEPR
ncbi:hypothetical protein ZWY2020_019193 [Hordeum vulgare]|nr:hypothetical protein ZWY2020_019193 [Hordeum vulgare]